MPAISLASNSMNSTMGTTPLLNTTMAGCMLDQSMAPGNLTLCGNATLFNTFRPKARFIAPEGWMNDPMGMYQREDGSIHAGYQSHPQHIMWGNISQGAAYSNGNSFTYWTDFGPTENGVPQDYKTIWPSTVYDIRGVFDGSIIKDGIDGNPTILYTSTNPIGPLGATAGEKEGVETQSLAYTTDDGASWIKLNYGANPVIYDWPMNNLTGFRDPYVFKSPELSMMLGNSSQGASGSHFATISGGVIDVGPKLWLYRQTEEGDVTKWTYLGPFLEEDIRSSWSDWSGNVGINFETAFVTRVNASGEAYDDGSDTSALNIVGYGTEQGRPDHQAHWPLWAAVDYSTSDNGTVTATTKMAGVADWGASYAFVSFPVDSQSVMVGWTYEDDNFALGTQMGYQGAFTLFRELFRKDVTGVDPNTPGINDKASWIVSNSTDGGEGVTITTLGQRVVPETLSAYKSGSQVSNPADMAVVAGYTAFETQPTGRHYAVAASFEFERNSTASAGVRVLGSDQEYTDIYYNLASEELTVVREKSSLIPTFNNATEVGKLRLWPQVGANTVTLNLTVIVDNSVIEIFANDEFALTTRAYPWLDQSVGAGLIAMANGSSSAIGVQASGMELWDGLVNAWPARAENTSRGLVWDGPTASLFGLWAGI